jgi:hypothetical protein
MRVALYCCVAFAATACDAEPPQAALVGPPQFQQHVRDAYARPTSSFYHYQLHAALSGDRAAIDSYFYQALYDAHSPYLPGSDEEIHVWELEALLHTLGEDRFIAELKHHYPAVQKAVLAPFDERMLQHRFPKVTAMRAKFFPR